MLNFELVATFLLVFARISSFVYTAPIFGGTYAPGMVKAGISFVLSMVVLPLIGVQQDVELGNLLVFALSLVREVCVGLFTGFICNMILQTLTVFGQIFDLHIGFMMSNFFDPTVGGQVTLTARFFYIMGLVLFFILDGHHMLILGLVKSFNILPLNTAVFGGTGALAMIRVFARMISVGVQLSAPVIAVALILDICLGLLGRTSPQMNIFMLGFPLKIGAGLLTLAIMAPMLGLAIQYLVRMMESDLYTLLKGLSQSG